jgi:hypothetical protein
MVRLIALRGSVALATFFAFQPAIADTVVVSAAADNTMYEYGGTPVEQALSNGTGQYIFAGKTGQGLSRRALIRFDLAGLIPADATINRVSLQLHMSQTISGDVAINLHRVRAPWGEGSSSARGNEGGGATAKAGDATWFHSTFPGVFWANPGGDFAPASSATTIVSWPDFYVFSGPGLEADVAMWASGAAPNNGWCLIGDENAPATAKRFDSRQNIDSEVWPVLTIDFTPAATGCVGDYNQDGGVDGSDIEAFFIDWEAGEGAADVNEDGGVDGGDIEFFFTRWDAGC